MFSLRLSIMILFFGITVICVFLSFLPPAVLCQFVCVFFFIASLDFSPSVHPSMLFAFVLPLFIFLCFPPFNSYP